MGGIFGAIMGGFISLSTARKQDGYLRLCLEMMLSFWLSAAGTWSAVGLTVIQQTGQPWIALATGFLAGLGVGSGAAYVRFATSQYSKNLGLTVPQVVAQRGEEVAHNGTEIQK